MTDIDMIDTLKAIAHPLRLKILSTLHAGECNVGEIETRARIGQPALSQQLAILRKAALVDTRKDAKLVYYRLSPEKLGAVSDAIAALANGGPAPEPAPVKKPPSPGAANFARMG